MSRVAVGLTAPAAASAPGDGSASATTSSSSTASSAPRWNRPIRPSPTMAVRSGSNGIAARAYDRPTISPDSSKSMTAAAGRVPRPGIVRISPQIG